MMRTNLITTHVHIQARKAATLLLLLSLLLSVSLPSTFPLWRSQAAGLFSTNGLQKDNDFKVRSEREQGLQRTIFSAPGVGTIYANLPDDMAAGDTLTGTVFAEPEGKGEERDKNLKTLREFSVEVNGQKISASEKSFKLTLPTTSQATAIAVQLLGNKGKTVARQEVPVLSEPPQPSTAVSLPPYGQAGRFISIKCPCDGVIAATDYIKVGGREVLMLAESPRQRIALNTSTLTGQTQIEMSERGQVTTAAFRNIHLKMTASKLNLRRGEQATMRVEVSGLENLKEELPLRLENHSMGVLTLGGGDAQMLTIRPADVQAGGVYTTERTLTGIQVGAFSIEGIVVWKNENAIAAERQGPPQAPPQAGPNELTSIGAHCWCRVYANGVEVFVESKGGYIQPIQKGKCLDYCRGVWGGRGEEGKKAWASLLPNSCGDVTLRMDAHLGTMNAQTVRGPETIHLGGVLTTECICPAGQILSKGNTYCIPQTGIPLPGVPDQVLQGGFLIQGGVLYKIAGSPCCRTYCKP